RGRAGTESAWGASGCGGAGRGDRRRRSRDRLLGIVVAGTLDPHWGRTLVLVTLAPGELTVPGRGRCSRGRSRPGRRAEGAPVAGWRPVGARERDHRAQRR